MIRPSKFYRYLENRKKRLPFGSLLISFKSLIFADPFAPDRDSAAAAEGTGVKR